MKSNYLKSLTTRISVLLLALLCLPLAAMAASAFGGGDGTEGNPYQIKTEADLKQLATDVNSGSQYVGTYFKLMNDITLTGEWIPIGITKNNDTKAFKGKFDGDKHSILGLCIKTQVGVTTYGLFGVVEDAVISNLHIQLADEGIQVDVTEMSNDYNIGAFAGVMNGVCRLANSCLTSTEKPGSIISVVGKHTVKVGGLVGYLNELYADTKIEYCYSTVSITTNSSDRAMVGGICGLNSGSISNCYAAGTIKISDYKELTQIGGIAGLTMSAKAGATVSNSLALNPVIEFAGAALGRITSYSQGISSGNYASTKTAGIWSYKGTKEIDGADTYAEIYLTDITWNPDVWTTSAESLPILKGFSNQPALRTLDYLEEGEKAPESWADVAKQAVVSTTEATADVYVKDDTFTINTEKGLAWLAGVVNKTLKEGDNFPSDTTFAGKTVKLGADLDLGKDAYKSFGWEPIGKMDEDFNNLYFKGNFDGQKHCIKGLWMDINSTVSSTLHLGLFGVVEDCTVSNLHIHLAAKGLKVKQLDGDSFFNLGTFVGTQEGTSQLVNCYLTAEEGGKVSIESAGVSSVGGMVGEATTIRNCYSTVPVSATTSKSSIVGGMCGAVNTSISNCYITGMVESIPLDLWGLYVGGLSGAAREATLSENLILNEIVTNGGKVGRITAAQISSTLSGNYAGTLTAGIWANKGASNLDGADTSASSFWNNLNGDDNKWSGFVKDSGNVNLPKLAGEWSVAQPDLAIATYLADLPRITFSQPETGGVLIVKDSLGKALISDTTLAKNDVLTLECLPLAGYQLKAFKANGTKIEANADSTYTFTVVADVAFTAEFEATATPAVNGVIHAAESEITTPVVTPAVVATADNLANITDFANIKLITGEASIANQATLAASISAVYKDTLFQDISLVEEILDATTGKVTSILPVQLKDGNTATLYIPYPAGTDKSYTFAIYHLNWKGVVETFSAGAGNLANTANGLKLTVTSFSPFAIAYKEKEEPTPPPYVPVYYTVTLPEVEGVTLSKNPGDYTVEEYESFDFSLELKDGYKNSVPVVKANDDVLQRRESDGRYLLSFVSSDTEITIEGIVKDIPTGIDNAGHAVRVRAAASTLYIYTPSEETAYIFNATGTLCREPLKVAGDAQLQLPAGFYLVKIADKTYKVVIR